MTRERGLPLPEPSVDDERPATTRGGDSGASVATQRRDAQRAPGAAGRATVALILAVVPWLAIGCRDDGATPAPAEDPTRAPEYQTFKSETEALYRQGDLHGALSRVARAVVAAPTSREPYDIMSGIYVELGQDADAAAFFAKLGERFPDSPLPPMFQGFHEYRQGRWDRALAAYQRASALDPANAEAHFRQGLILQSQGSFDEALVALRRARDLNPGDPVAAARLVRLLRITGDYPAAMRTADDALADFPTYPDLHHARGLLLQREGRLPEAEQSLRQALALDPGHREAHYDLARLLRRTGREEEGRREEAIARRLTDYLETKESLTNQLAARPDDPSVALALAEAELTEDVFDAALGWFRRADALSGPRERIAAGSAEAHFGLGQIPQGDRMLEALVGLTDARAELARAAKRVALGRLAEAVSFLDQAVGGGPEEREFLRRAADLYAACGRPERSEPLLQRAASAPGVGEITSGSSE